MGTVDGDWIAYRLALLVADKRGRLRNGAVLWDQAVRLALLIDLAQRDRIRIHEQSTDLDTTPTNFPAADALIAYVQDHPEGSIMNMFQSAPIGLADVAVAQTDRPYSLARSNITRIEPALAEAERKRVATAAISGVADQATAILTVLADALLLTAIDPDTDLNAQCGPNAQLVIECADYLRALGRSLIVIPTPSE